MARTLGDRLLRVSEATSKEATLWREGANLERVTGKTIDVLRLEAAVDRWRLADEFRIRADKFSRAKPARTRDAISRYYYSMYHAMRAAAYVFHGGDDHQEHRVLPGKTPPDFPNASYWENRLKDAREIRNRADYDPYPKSAASWSRIGAGLESDCRQLLADAKSYLVGKGCMFT